VNFKVFIFQLQSFIDYKLGNSDALLEDTLWLDYRQWHSWRDICLKWCMIKKQIIAIF